MEYPIHMELVWLLPCYPQAKHAEDNTMLIFDLTTGQLLASDQDQGAKQTADNQAPSWHTPHTQLQSVPQQWGEIWKPAPTVVATGPAWLEDN
jgi:hypothetical protein